MQYKRRKDANHGEIMRAFESLGCPVQDLYAVAGGCPDILVAVGWINVLVEIKNGEKAKYTEAQDKFNARWTGARATVRDLAGVETLVKAYRRGT